MAETFKRTPPVCDFCSSEKIAWSYPCKSFAINLPVTNVTANSIEDWAACMECHAFIQRGDRAGLATRSIETQREELEKASININVAIGWVTRLHKKFWESRLGPPIPVQERLPKQTDGSLTIETPEN